MSFVVALDACVLYPLPLRDTLLRVAQQNLFAVRWSRRILDEVTRNLIEDRRATPEQAKSLVEAMERAFKDAEIPEPTIADLEPIMSNRPADRAAAVADEDVRTIVTFTCATSLSPCASKSISRSCTRTRSSAASWQARARRSSWRSRNRRPLYPDLR